MAMDPAAVSRQFYGLRNGGFVADGAATQRFGREPYFDRHASPFSPTVTGNPGPGRSNTVSHLACSAPFL